MAGAACAANQSLASNSKSSRLKAAASKTK